MDWWTDLPDDQVIQIFSCLNHRDRASLSSTCKAWWTLSKSTFLWQTLDLRFTNLDDEAATSLASRCVNLQKLRVTGNEFASSIVNLEASDLKDIHMDNCTLITDMTLSVLLAPHDALECIQIMPGVNHDWIDGSAIKVMARCCPNLKKLWLTSVNAINGEAINGLTRNLTDMRLIDCANVDEAALGNITTLRFLSVAGTINVNWNLAALHWSKLVNLTCLDVSRTNIEPRDVSELLSSCLSLKVLSAFSWPVVDHDPTSIIRRGVVLVGFFTDILKELSSLFADMPNEKGNVFLGERYSNNFKDRKLEGALDWLECTICELLLYVSTYDTPDLDGFWFHQGVGLLCSFLQSPHEEVQEKATTALATFARFGDVKETEAILRGDVIHFLINLARSPQEVLQLEAVRALVNLPYDGDIAKAIIYEGGIEVLTYNAKSANKIMAREALEGPWILAPYDDNKSAFAEAGGIPDLIQIIVRWYKSNGGEYVLERATCALAKLALYDKYRTEIALAGGFHVLETLLRTDMPLFVQNAAASCLAAMTIYNDSSKNLAALVRQETGLLKTFVQLVHSPSDGVKKEASSTALWYLSHDEINRDEIAAVGGVPALVSLANSCVNDSSGYQAVAVGTLWQLSISVRNRIAIGQEGGVTPLLALAKSDNEKVQEMAAGALWNLASNAENAVRIIEEDGVPMLMHLCSSSISKLARFLSALTLVYMFDIRLVELARTGTSSGSTSKSSGFNSATRMIPKAIEVFLKSCSEPHALSAVASSLSPSPAALERVIVLAHIEDIDALECSGSDIIRLLTMMSHGSPMIKSCCAFALLQFTLPGGVYALNNANLLQNAGARRKLRATAASLSDPLEAKAFARVALSNLEHHQVDHCIKRFKFTF